MPEADLSAAAGPSTESVSRPAGIGRQRGSGAAMVIEQERPEVHERFIDGQERVLTPVHAGRGHVSDDEAAGSARVVYYMGQRIYFRPLELSDEPDLRRWINDPRNWQTLKHRGPLNALREREWIESLGRSTSDYVFGIVLRDEDRLIGTVGLHAIDPRTRSATLGLLIGEVAYQNRGYGREATRLAIRYGFRELNLNRIQLSVYANNWRAIRAYQKAGFVHEGCLRQAQYVNGQYVDEYHFAILREEWENLPAVVNTDRYA